MTAKRLTRKSPQATLDMLQEYADYIEVMQLGDNWDDIACGVDVDSEVRFDHRPVDPEEFSIHTDGL